MRGWLIGCLCLFGVFALHTGCSTNNGNDEQVKDGGVKDSPTTPQCLTARDCKKGEDCVKGVCKVAQECSDFSECEKDERCSGGYCLKRCDVDTDCPEQHVCTDGQCHKPDWKTAKAPNEGSTATKPLQIGLGVEDLDHPLSVSMAGYGFRPGPKGPYAKALGSSEGMYDRFKVKALVLDNGVERIAVIRSPLVFSTDYFITQISQYIIEKTQVNMIDKILFVSTHSHSAPARFWNLLPDLGFGTFGGGDFHPEVFRRMVASFGNAIIKANKDLQPGKFAYHIDPNFDPEKVIFSNRRSENSDYRHPYLLVARAERLDGTPIAALVSFPMHGTINSTTFMTNDAAGGLEFGVQEILEKKYKSKIEVFFLQGCAGDISPRGDRLGHKKLLQMQMLGRLAGPKILEYFDGLKDKGKTDISLEVVNRRIPLSRKALGYKDDEFFQLKDGEKLPYRFGAFQCVKDGFNFNTDPDGRHTDGKLGCIFSFEVLHGGPAVQFSKTRLSAARIGDLIISTFPGEATSPVAKALRDGFIAKTGGKLKDVVVLGYAQDHQLYITRENDWWRGGYEATMSTWGFKVGEYLINNAIDLTVQLTTTEKEKNDTGILPVDHYKLDLTPTIERVVTPEAGTIATQPPKEYKRMALEPMTFIISGGWVGVDHPKVVLQKKEGGAFKDVMRDGGQRVYDDADYRMVLEFRKVAADKVHYEYRFQELETFPAGTYRFHVEGQKWDGSKRVPYTVDTDAFEIVPGDNMRVNTVSLEKDKIAAYVSYPAGSNDDGKSDFGALSATGHRLRSSLVRWEVGPPLPENADVEIKITIKDSADKEEIVEVKKLNVYKKDKINIVTKRKEGKETTSEMETQVSGFTAKLPNTLAAGKYTVTIEVKDAHGNTGVWGPKELEIK